MLIEWKDEYGVGINEIDEQHKKFIDIINKLNEGLHVVNIKIDLLELVNELVDFAKEHFSTEEKYFEKFKYPKKDKHIEEHMQFSKQMDEFSSQINGNNMEVSFSLIDYLEDWFVHHLKTQDHIYGEYFKENGYI